MPSTPVFRRLPLLSLYLLSLLLIGGAASAASQTTKTVIDILSENVEFSYFLRVVQREGLVPILNQLEDITLIAPVNSAFATKFGCYSIETCGDVDIPTNDLYHYIIDANVIFERIEGTLLYKTIQTEKIHASPVLVLADRETDKYKINNIDVVELDLIAKSQNSAVQGIDKLLDVLPPLKEQIAKENQTHKFLSLLNERDLTNKTVLVPTDFAIEFEDYEFNYLLSEAGSKEKDFIINSLLINDFWGGDIPMTSVRDLNGNLVKLSNNNHGGQFWVNETFASIKSNILASDGVIHLFGSSKLISPVEMNLMKLLIGLDASEFVKELNFQGLTDLITDNELEQTLFIPKDYNQALKILSKSSDLYHFVGEEIFPDSSKTLYYTKFCNNKKIGQGCQAIKVDKLGDHDMVLNNNILVESGPYKVGNSAVYLIDEDLKTPGNLESAVSPVHHCSQSVKFLEQLNLLKLANNNMGYTFFLPCYESWNPFDLTLKVLEQNTTLFQYVFKNLILNGLVYTDFGLQNENLINLNDKIIKVEGKGTEDGVLQLNFNGLSIDLNKSDDILFSQGVVHPIKRVLFPDDLDISLRQIAGATDSGPFLQFLGWFSELYETLEDGEYSLILPTSRSMLRLDPFKSNLTLQDFLKLHIIPSGSLEKIYNCEDHIETILPDVFLGCSNIPGSSANLLKIENGEDFEIRIIGQGCSSKNPVSCIYWTDRPLLLDWIEGHQHYHLTLPGTALAVGILLGFLSMVIFFSCSLMLTLKKNKQPHPESGMNTDVPETEALLANNNGNSESSQSYLSTDNFETAYSNNSVANPISVNSKVSKDNFVVDS